MDEASDDGSSSSAKPLTRFTFLQVAISAGVVLALALVAAFWALADPRSEIKSIRENFLTIREHNEYRDAVKEDLRRIEQNNGAKINRTEVQAVWDLRSREIETMHRDIEHLRQEMHEHVRDDRDHERAKGSVK